MTTIDPGPGVQLLFDGTLEVSMEKNLDRHKAKRLIDELTEGVWNSRGYESHMVTADQVKDGDQIQLFNDEFRIHSVMREVGDMVCLQWSDGGEDCDLVVPYDFEVRVYRPVE